MLRNIDVAEADGVVAADGVGVRRGKRGEGCVCGRGAVCKGVENETRRVSFDGPTDAGVAADVVVGSVVGIFVVVGSVDGVDVGVGVVAERGRIPTPREVDCAAVAGLTEVRKVALCSRPSSIGIGLETSVGAVVPPLCE